MPTRPLRPNLAIAAVAFTVLFGVMLACVRAFQPDDPANWVAAGEGGAAPVAGDLVSGDQAGGPKSFSPPTRDPNLPILTPTPDAPHPLPAMRTEADQYTVQPGDALGKIAQQFGVSIQELVKANELVNPDLLEVGQVLNVPVPTPEGSGPAFKIIPDSELVYSPYSAEFDINGFVQAAGGYLAQYREEVGDEELSGAEIVEKVADSYSVNPRLLLAVIEQQSRWVTDPDPKERTLEDPLKLGGLWDKGLYPQTAWVANALNLGYYTWRVNGAAAWVLADGAVVPINPTINAGTAAVQSFYSKLYGQEKWQELVTEEGLFAAYNRLFGYPFDFALEPLLPGSLSQPEMLLPFEEGKDWAFTGGPHGGWDSGSAWAALDFAPPSDALGCVSSDEWVTASADGLVVRAGEGAVVQDLDGDGYEQTGWTLLYMHIESRDRVEPGTYLNAGDRVGHPSCEGGVSNGTHVHLARRYNGEWIPADQDLPFVLGGWVSRGLGSPYDGVLERNGRSIEAWAGRSPDNAIHR